MVLTIPVEALGHLEPRSGGQWTVTPHSPNAYTASYRMRDGLGISFSLTSFATTKEVEEDSPAHIYKFTGAPEVDGEAEHQRSPSSNGFQGESGYVMEAPMHAVIRPRQPSQNGESQSHVAHSNLNTGASVHPPAPSNLLFPHGAPTPQQSAQSVQQLVPSQSMIQTNFFPAGQMIGANQNIHPAALGQSVHWNEGNNLFAQNSQFLIDTGNANMSQDSVLNDGGQYGGSPWDGDWADGNETPQQGTASPWELNFQNTHN